MNKLLSIEELDSVLKNGFSSDGGSELVDSNEILPILKQLADTMRENERLKKECTFHVDIMWKNHYEIVAPALARAVAMLPDDKKMEFCGVIAKYGQSNSYISLNPYKHSVGDGFPDIKLCNVSGCFNDATEETGRCKFHLPDLHTKTRVTQSDLPPWPSDFD